MTATNAIANRAATPQRATPESWRVTPEGSVPVADVIRSAKVPHGAVDYAVRLGLVSITEQPRPRCHRSISVEDGLLLLAAASLALAAGTALVAMLRAIKSANATVNPQSLTLTIKF